MNLSEAITANPALLGATGMMVSGAVLYLLREVPKKIFGLAWLQVTTTLSIRGSDDAYEWFEEWLAQHESTKRARRLKLSTSPSAEEWNVSPGFGDHVIWEGGPVLVKRTFEPKDGGWGGNPKAGEAITLTVFGRDQARLRKMVAVAHARMRDPNQMKAFQLKDGWWQSAKTARKRQLASVFLPAWQKAKLSGRIRWFLANEPWYRARGIPYRLGIFLHGPPGTGKTSLVRALASEFTKPIYVANLASVKGDAELLGAFCQVERGAFLLLEDVDSFGAAQEREPSDESPMPGGSPKSPERITASGLLNAIDGVASPEGIVLVMTTNHPERIDPALLRPGRADLKIEVGHMLPSEVAQMGERFKPGTSLRWSDEASLAAPRPACDWQAQMIEACMDDDLESQ